MNNKIPRPTKVRFLAGAVLGLALTAGYSGAANAATYTAQELANIEMVRGLYTMLDAADARGDTSTAIKVIAAKFISPNYIQHANGDVGRDKFEALFNRGGAGGRAGGAGGPPAGAAGAGAAPRAQVVRVLVLRLARVPRRSFLN
jgi:hypothetical protein